MSKCEEMTIYDKTEMKYSCDFPEEIKNAIKEEIIETFKNTAFNTCENQELNLLKGTEMAVIINENAVPKSTMKPIPCPLNLRDQAKKDLE